MDAITLLKNDHREVEKLFKELEKGKNREQLFKELKNVPVNYVVPASGTPVITDGIALVRDGPNPEEAKRFYEFVTTPESLVFAAQKYFRIPVRTDLDRSQLPAWMNEPFTRMPLDWELLRKNGSDWLRYWDTEIRGKNR